MPNHTAAWDKKDSAASAPTLLPNAMARSMAAPIRGHGAKPTPSRPVRKSLAAKLGITDAFVEALIGEPEGFRATLGEPPAGARIHNRIDGATVLLLFVKSAAALGRELPSLAGAMRKGRGARPAVQPNRW